VVEIILFKDGEVKTLELLSLREWIKGQAGVFTIYTNFGGDELSVTTKILELLRVLKDTHNVNWKTRNVHNKRDPEGHGIVSFKAKPSEIVNWLRISSKISTPLAGGQIKKIIVIGTAPREEFVQKENKYEISPIIKELGQKDSKYRGIGIDIELVNVLEEKEQKELVQQIQLKDPQIIQSNLKFEKKRKRITFLSRPKLMKMWLESEHINDLKDKIPFITILLKLNGQKTLTYTFLKGIFPLFKSPCQYALLEKGTYSIKEEPIPGEEICSTYIEKEKYDTVGLVIAKIANK